MIYRIYTEEKEKKVSDFYKQAVGVFRAHYGRSPIDDDKDDVKILQTIIDRFENNAMNTIKYDASNLTKEYGTTRQVLKKKGK